MRLLRAFLILVTAALILVVSLVLSRAPELYDMWRYDQCIKKHSADVGHDKQIEAAIGRTKIERARVREFLNAEFPNLPVREDKAGIWAGSINFAGDPNADTVSYIPEVIPCWNPQF